MSNNVFRTTCEQVLKIRLAYSQAATKKFDAIADTAYEGRMLETLQPWGASRTGRWAGRGLQVQNLKRPTMPNPEIAADLLVDDPDLFARIYTLEDLGSLVRSAIKAPEGYRLVVADLASIESRVLGWLSKCARLNRVFAEGKDTYKDFAQHLFHIPYDEVTRAQRVIAKPAVLGAGYGIGGPGLQKYATGMGVELTEDEALESVGTWRRTYPEVPKYWSLCEARFKAAVMASGVKAGGMIFDKTSGFLKWQLPSGRFLWYFEPEISEEDNSLSFMGQNQFTNKWERIPSWGGRLVENITQAVARDVLVEGLRRASLAGLDIAFHVHDEIVVISRAGAAERELEILIECMSAPVDWAPGLLLGAEGYVAERYRKG